MKLYTPTKSKISTIIKSPKLSLRSIKTPHVKISNMKIVKPPKMGKIGKIKI